MNGMELPMSNMIHHNKNNFNNATLFNYKLTTNYQLRNNTSKVYSQSLYGNYDVKTSEFKQHKNKLYGKTNF